jgi:hypothetical protein
VILTHRLRHHTLTDWVTRFLCTTSGSTEYGTRRTRHRPQRRRDVRREHLNDSVSCVGNQQKRNRRHTPSPRSRRRAAREQCRGRPTPLGPVARDVRRAIVRDMCDMSRETCTARDPGERKTPARAHRAQRDPPAAGASSCHRLVVSLRPSRSQRSSRPPALSARRRRPRHARAPAAPPSSSPSRAPLPGPHAGVEPGGAWRQG